MSPLAAGPPSVDRLAMREALLGIYRQRLDRYEGELATVPRRRFRRRRRIRLDIVLFERLEGELLDALLA